MSDRQTACHDHQCHLPKMMSDTMTVSCAQPLLVSIKDQVLDLGGKRKGEQTWRRGLGNRTWSTPRQDWSDESAQRRIAKHLAIHALGRSPLRRRLISALDRVKVRKSRRSTLFFFSRVRDQEVQLPVRAATSRSSLTWRSLQPFQPPP